VDPNTQDTQPEVIPGTLCPKNVFSGTCYTADPAGDNPLSSEEKKALGELVRIASACDPASRRIAVEQCWKARLFQRGYQRLIPRKNGGWLLPGANSSWGNNKVTESQTDNGQVNVYGRDHDIIVSALSSEVPKVRFFAHKMDEDADVTAADAANSYKYYFNSSNCMDNKLGEIASYFFTDGISVTFTRSVASAKFGYIDQNNIDPVEPETEQVPPSQEEQEEEQAVETVKTPRIREIVTVYGALEAKVPTSVQSLEEMPYVQLYQEVDLATAKAMYPYISKKIQPTASNAGELELDRIARLNVKMNMGVSYTTGDSLEREVTTQLTFLRPAMLMDDAVKSVRDTLLEKFPDGVLVEYAGTEFACATALNPDDHLCVIHSNPGSGQNRRALGTSIISIQERLNRLTDLQMDFFTRTVPNRYFDAEAFDLQLMSQQANLPGVSIPFQRQPGIPFSELLGADIPIQANPQMLEFMSLLQGTWSQDLTGALPSLFGGASDTNTVGNAVLQRNQALQRLAFPWKMIKGAVACIVKQAVQSAANNNNDAISDIVKGIGRIEVEMQDLRGNVLCYPESDSDFPESWAQRQAVFLEAVQNAPQNPFLQALISVPSNSTMIKDAIGLSELEVPGAASTEKQQAELAILKKGAPVPNPQLGPIQQKLQAYMADNQQAQAQGIPVPPEVQAEIQQMQQQISTLPPEVSTVPVMTDASEEHAVEASVCQQWLISPEGRTYKNGDELQRAGWGNTHLHWNEHMTQAKQLNPPTPAPPKATLQIAFKDLPAQAQAAVAQEFGVNVDPQAFSQNPVHEQTQEVEQVTPNGGKVKQTVSVAGKPLNS
jgi:hypothetical protein